MKEKAASTDKLVLVSLLIAATVAVNYFGVDMPVGGAPVLRINFGGSFFKFCCILLGPLYGAVAGALIDLLGYIIKPTGAYIPFLTLTFALEGALLGVIWQLVKNINSDVSKRVYIAFFTVIGIIGIANTFSLRFFPDSALSVFISGIGSKSAYATIGFIGASAAGYIFYIVVSLMMSRSKSSMSKSKSSMSMSKSKSSMSMSKSQQAPDKSTRKLGIKLPGLIVNNLNTYLKIIIATGIPTLLITTINTFILKAFIPSLGDRAFMFILIPRLMEKFLIIPIDCYILLLIMEIYSRIKNKSSY